jgi:hypothetical protein
MEQEFVQPKLEPIFGRKKPAGTVGDPRTTDAWLHWEKAPLREPHKSMALVAINKGSYPIRLREDLPADVKKLFKKKSKTHRKGVPYVARIGQQFDPVSHTTVPIQVYYFLPGEVQRIGFEHASDLLDDKVHSTYLEEAPEDDFYDDDEDGAPAEDAKKK